MEENETIAKILDDAHQRDGFDEIERIAEFGTGRLKIAPEDRAALLAAFGAPGEALYAIHLAAQRRVSAAVLQRQQERDYAQRSEAQDNRRHDMPAGPCACGAWH